MIGELIVVLHGNAVCEVEDGAVRGRGDIDSDFERFENRKLVRAKRADFEEFLRSNCK
ncbi:hypothetical protein CCP2SC5_120033 [Azospirillaceae bacterium]